MAIKAYIADKYPDKVLSNQSFDVGYFDGKLNVGSDVPKSKKRRNTVVRWCIALVEEQPDGPSSKKMK